MTGEVCVINTTAQIEKMKEGDILVSINTNPSLMSAIQKAGAIVTDEGGITCHAAIISRELKKPCCIGVENATRLISDGDFLDVDSEKGIILIILTLGIYSFWYMEDLFAFEINNIKASQNGKEINLRSTLSGGDVFQMVIVNTLIIIFTFGIGTGIAINRSMVTSLSNIEFDSEIDAETLVQTEEEYKDATGEDLSDMFELSIF